MDKESKLNAIAKIKQEQLKLLKKAIKILMLPQGKKPSTTIKRSIRLVEILIRLRILQEQIKLIIYQPIKPNFNKGGVIIGGKAHKKKEIIQTNKDKFINID